MDANVRAAAAETLRLCREAGHDVIECKVKKRFFRCNHCKEQATTLGAMMPRKACGKCGRSEWVRSGMLREDLTKKTEEREIMRPRGEEHAFSLRSHW